MFQNYSISSSFLLAICLLLSCNTKTQISSSTPSEKTEPFTLTDIWAMFQDSKGNIWFGGNENRASYYDGTKLHILDITESFFTGRVIGIQEDKQGNIYFDTTDGVCKYDGSNFERLSISESAIRQEEWTLNPEDLWFRMGFDKDGAYTYDGQDLHFMQFSPTEYSEAYYQRHPFSSFTPLGIYEIYKDRNGHVWFGTAAAGAGRYDGKSVSWIYQDKMTTTPSGGSLGIRSILHDKHGKFWFTNFREVFTISEKPILKDGTSYLDYTSENGMPSLLNIILEGFPYFQSLKEDSQGNLWSATYSEGIYKKTDSEISHYRLLKDGTDVTVFSLLIDKNDGIWATSHEGGIFKFDGASFLPFTFRI